MLMSLHKRHTNGALDEIKEYEERLRSVIKSAIDAVILIDSNGKIISWNNSAERNFLYTEEEVLGKPLTIIIPDGYINFRQEDAEFSNKHDEGTIFTFTLSLKRKGVTG
jgi:PAS domain S-box-containing protein